MRTVWIETSRRSDEAAEGWGVGECVWAPTGDRRGSDRYGIIRDLNVGDTVIHIANGWLAGRSQVLKSCYECDPPKDRGSWSYATRFYRVDLELFERFENPLLIAKFLDLYGDMIEEDINTSRPHRYPFAIYRYHGGGTAVKGVQGRFLTQATPTLLSAILEATSSLA